MNTKITLGQRLARLLENAEGNDLDSLDQEIVAAEARVKSLKVVREILAEEVLNRPTVSNSSSNVSHNLMKEIHKANNEATKVTLEEAINKVGKFLTFSGPKRIDAIRRQMNFLNEDILEKVLATEYFERDGTVYRLSAKGETKFREKQVG